MAVLRVAVLAVLFCFVTSAGPTQAQGPEERDARAVFSARGHSGALSVVRRYARMGDVRVGVVKRGDMLYVVFGERVRQGWRSQVRYLVDASETMTSNHDLSIATISEASRIFAVKFALRPPAPDPSPCACSARGGTHRTRWFHLDAAGELHRLVDFDPNLGSAVWNEQAKHATVTQGRGPLRCPRGCPPAPAYELITETLYRFTAAGFEPISEEYSRRY